MSGLIAVSLKKIKHFPAALRSGADLLELRTDFFSAPQILRLAKRSTLPVILTIKCPCALPTSLPRTIKYIDLDYKVAPAKVHNLPRGLKIIQSFHDFKTTPAFAQLERMVKQMQQRQTIPKIATTIRTVEDLAVIARLQKTYGKNIIAIGMGELGLMTRLYNKSLLTFAAISTSSKTAPGQLTVAQLRSGMQLYGLIGDAITHSLSPRLHNTWFKQKHLPHRYQLWQTDNLAAFMQVFDFFQLPGASITKPFKKAIIPYCDKLDRHAKAIGAVNTLVRRGQRLHGFNTDWVGVKQVLGPALKHARILILGNGGVAAAVAYAAKQAPAKKITLLSHATLPTIQTDFDVVINATPVRNKLLVPATALTKNIVMDCNYGQPTKLLQVARLNLARRGLDGLPMLRAQAKEQFKLWTNQSKKRQCQRQLTRP